MGDIHNKFPLKPCKQTCPVLNHDFLAQAHQPMFKKLDYIEKHYQTIHLPSISSLEL